MMRWLWASLIALAVVFPSSAHPPKGLRSGPSSADPYLRAAAAARKRGDQAAFREAIVAARKALAAEGRFTCCISGGCTECAFERGCGCGASLFAKEGVCKECVLGIRGGGGRYSDIDPAWVFVESMAGMPGATGPWRMAREGSGTAWIPDTSPLYARMSAPSPDGWRTMEMLSGVFGGIATTGPRGTAQGYGATQAMVMGRKDMKGDATFGWRAMFSLDALANGRRGVPNLFQSGATIAGMPVPDRQHPHELLVELSAAASRAIGRGVRATAYVAPVGEPALGGSAYRHRPSAWDNPETSLSHHALEGFHVSSGVATAGIVVRDSIRAEWSRFNARENDENRFDIDPVRFTAQSARLSWNPNREVSVQASYGRFGAMDGGHGGDHGWMATMSMPDTKATLSAAWHRSRGSRSRVSAYVAHALDRDSDGRGNRALLMEAASRSGDWSLFTRWERVDTSDLVDVPPGRHTVGRWTLGGARILSDDGRSERSLGASVGIHSVPSGLRSAYGGGPLSVQVFWRVRSPLVR